MARGCLVVAGTVLVGTEAGSDGGEAQGQPVERIAEAMMVL